MLSCGSEWQGYLGLPLPLAPHLRRPSQPQLTVHQSQPLAAHFPSQQRVVRPRTDDPHTHCVGPPRLTLCSASRFDTLFDVKTGASPLRSA